MERIGMFKDGREIWEKEDGEYYFFHPTGDIIINCPYNIVYDKTDGEYYDFVEEREEALARMPKRVEFDTEVISCEYPEGIAHVLKHNFSLDQELFPIGQKVTVKIEEVQE